MSASPLSASFRLCRCQGGSVSTTSSVGRTCAYVLVLDKDDEAVSSIEGFASRERPPKLTGR